MDVHGKATKANGIYQRFGTCSSASSLEIRMEALSDSVIGMRACYTRGGARVGGSMKQDTVEATENRALQASVSRSASSSGSRV